MHIYILTMTTTFSWATTSNPLKQIFSGTQFNFLQYILGNWSSISCDASGENLVAINTYLPLNNIFISSNYGANWSDITTSLGNINLSQVVIASNAQTLCLASIRHSIYVSNNLGNTWNQYMFDGQGYTYIACSSNGQIILVTYTNNYINTSVTFSGNLTLSIDNGVTFNTVLGIPNCQWTGVDMNESGTIMVSCSSDGFCYISNDSGSSWSQVSLPQYTWNAISMDKTGNYIVICSSNGYIYVSTDAGSSWTSCSPRNLIWNNIVISKNANIIFATALNSSYIYYSTDNGTSWTTSSPKANSTNWGSICCNSDGSIVYACINGGFIYIGTQQT